MRKKLVLLLSCLLLTGCGEKKVTGENRDTGTGLASKEPTVLNENAGPSVDSSTVKSRPNEVGDLSPLPEIITKEFIMGLWAKPHNGKGVIEELVNTSEREGVWKVVTTMGPNKKEMSNVDEGTMTVKVVDRRFQVWEWQYSDGENIEYSFITYDFDSEMYRWWGVLQPEGSISEWSGKRYWKNLLKWNSIQLKDENTSVTLRSNYLSEDRKTLKMSGEIRQSGEVVGYRKDEFTWLSELPEKHR